MLTQFEYKQLGPSFLVCKPENAPVGNPFYKQKVVFTGDLEGWDRQTAAYLVQTLGGDVDQQVSGKTDVVVIGKKPGPSKMEKVIDILASGKLLVVMNERVFNLETLPYLHLIGITNP